MININPVKTKKTNINISNTNIYQFFFHQHESITFNQKVHRDPEFLIKSCDVNYC
jgi:hypothetical protein